MAGEKNLERLLKTMKPVQHPGSYVFCTVNDMRSIEMKDILFYVQGK
jgi:uncharacterized protein